MDDIAPIICALFLIIVASELLYNFIIKCRYGKKPDLTYDGLKNAFKDIKVGKE